MSHLSLAFGRVAEGWIDFDASGQRAAVGRAAVATANPLASWAALRTLRAGGSAVDAAVAAQAVLTLVEPNASGIGGGAMIVLHAGGRAVAYDGLSAAPAAAPAAIAPETGGITVGVPGALAALAMAHAANGALPWRGLFDDAVGLAEEGFALSPYLHRTLRDIPAMHGEAQAAMLYAGLAAGQTIRNPALAATLRAVASDGAAGLYAGALAQRIAAVVQGDGGVLTTGDMAEYRAVARAPIRFGLGGMTVLGGPLPCYGAISAGQIVGIAAALGMTGIGAMPDAAAIHVLATAGRLAQADRFPYEDGPVDVAAMLDPGYLAARARLFDAGHLPPNLPGGHERGGSMTSHLSIADGRGQVLAMTTTINQNFGARLSVGGFYLNNVMTNFAAVPEKAGRRMPNASAPGKRARTTIGPCIVLDEAGAPVAVLGAGGGYRIIGYVANALLRLAGGMRDPQAILTAPHALNWEGTTEIEPALADREAALRARGHAVTVKPLDGATQMVTLDGARALAFGDLRRDGAGMAFG